MNKLAEVMKTQQQQESAHNAEDSSIVEEFERPAESEPEPEVSQEESQGLFKIIREIEDIKVNVVESQPIDNAAEQQVPEDMDYAKATIIAQYQRHEIVSDGGDDQVEEISGIISMIKGDVDKQRLDEIQQETLQVHENPIAQLNAISKLVAEIELANEAAQDSSLNESTNVSSTYETTTTAAAAAADDNTNDNNNEGNRK